MLRGRKHGESDFFGKSVKEMTSNQGLRTMHSACESLGSSHCMIYSRIYKQMEFTNLASFRMSLCNNVFRTINAHKQKLHSRRSAYSILCSLYCRSAPRRQNIYFWAVPSLHANTLSNARCRRNSKTSLRHARFYQQRSEHTHQ